MSHSVRKTLIGVAPIALLMSCALAVAQAPAPVPEHQHKDVAPTSAGDPTAKHESGMHMHKSDLSHTGSDAEVAKEFKGDATELRAMAASHRKLAALYKTRTPLKGQVSYTNVAAHCEQLAKAYEDAAKASEAMSSELSKQ